MLSHPGLSLYPWLECNGGEREGVERERERERETDIGRQSDRGTDRH